VIRRLLALLTGRRRSCPINIQLTVLRRAVVNLDDRVGRLEIKQ